MGERKGQNKYYPPDYDPRKGGLNKFQGTHALRERARKIHLGIIIIRFEMPYNIWCDGCKNHIGMGVRYNAEKTKVGMYYSTPIYKFRMKCHLCDNHFEIQTDPGNLDYVILSGARRQENRWDPTQNEQVVPETKEVQKRLFDDAMYKLEHQAKDIVAGEKAKPILEKLIDRNKTLWNDCYEANCKLRSEFRSKKKELKALKEIDDKLLAKSSLDIDLLPETQQDRQMASLMKLQSKSAHEREEERRLDILMKPALPSATQTTFGGLKRQKALNSQLQYEQLGIKRKLNTAETEANTSEEFVEAKKVSNPSEVRNENENTKDKSRDDENISQHQTVPVLVDLPKSLALVCDYASSNSSSPSPSQHSDNDGE
ncbi:coiled-coil domain-containing protein 130 homolog [Musca domestica]|uniref:Coiled-coil domain-containing protein 130 homolog n=1 Tax=Musca domestica TaxID=7370 RepID=A0A1I8NH00_MUSDO|nr:coiled-coil domain-containing protein 130 homolog [Musca domestica]XP_058982058.1 coiled-coil domain-containing protein 130 homolog [Musca domestica]